MGGLDVEPSVSVSRVRQKSPGSYDTHMAAPLVAVSAANTPDSRGFDRASLNLSYLRALEDTGVLPLVVSPGMHRENLEDALSRCAGLVLTGGGDVDPARYGQERHPTIVGVSEMRDTLEFDALTIAEECRMPVLAICRGMQVLNVWAGGALIQDIPSAISGACAHSVQEPRHRQTHEVVLADGCRAATILPGGSIGVNSRHHQALDPARLGAGLTVVGRSPDGVIEAVEVGGERFVLGVQWHPEDMATGPEDVPERIHARALFAAFADAARGFASRS